MTTKTTRKKQKETPGGGEPPAGDRYIGPPPPGDGRLVALDVHPDSVTAAVFRGTTPHNAVKLAIRENMPVAKALEWAAAGFDARDLFVMEAGANSFEIHDRLAALGLRAVVAESRHVGAGAKSHTDNDKLAAGRIALVYLAGNTPCVWVPDAVTRERRALLHAYEEAVAGHTAAVNSLKGFLNQFAIRPGNRGLKSEKTCKWLLAQRPWSGLEREILDSHLQRLDQSEARRRALYTLIARQIAAEPLMLRCMKLLGVGQVSAFALLAIIGDVRRFANPRKLVAYAGLNPGHRDSGTHKRVKLGVGGRGRGDIRRLLMQGAHSILRAGRDTPLGKWGWKLFARKGVRNVAVAAIARKLLTQVWYLLAGLPPASVEGDKSLRIKLGKLAHTLGEDSRARLSLPRSVSECVRHFQALVCAPEGGGGAAAAAA